MNGQGIGDYSTIIEALSWVSRDAKSKQGQKSVVNLSIGGIYNDILNEAVNALIRQGVHVVVAAGNTNENACFTSPASSKAIVIGASDSQDQRASFSNYGQCLTLFAPGVLIRSSLPNQQYGLMSGTSMASPIVSGILACLLDQKPMSPDAAKLALISDATSGYMKDMIDESPNKLIHIQ